MKLRKVVLVTLVITLIVILASVLLAYSLLRARHWEVAYYGKSNGVACEVLYTETPYRTLKQYLAYRHSSNTLYYCETWVKLDKSIGGAYDFRVENYDPYPAVPAGTWVKIDSRFCTPDLNKQKTFLLSVAYHYEKYGKGVGVATLEMSRVKRPPFLPECKPKHPFSWNF